MYFTEDKELFVQGDTDMPVVLLSASIDSGGGRKYTRRHSIKCVSINQIMGYSHKIKCQLILLQS